jgi:CheY-like chemotaxis protein
MPAYILVVEDMPVNAEIAKMLLEEEGHKVDIATNGQEAVILFQQNKYDLVLMDIQMPVMDGYDATHHLRQLNQHQQRPIIAMTANATTEDRKQCLEAGMDDFITKPIDLPLLLDRIDHWLKDPTYQQA